MTRVFMLAGLALATTSLMAEEANKPVPAASQVQEFWGSRLPETLKVTFWSSKDGESAASSISTSREQFSASFQLGSDNKGGVKLWVKGRVLPTKEGAYEVLLDLSVEGGSKDGNLDLKLKTSAILKKGAPVSLASNKDGHFFIRIQ